MKEVPMTVTVNGERHQLTVPPWETLIECLRDRLGLLGVKKSCEVQVCGACTVLLDDRPVSACTVLAFEARGTHVRTIEGLARGDDLHPVQAAFVEHGALQCGFCTPGMIMATVALLEENPTPTADQVKRYMRGNICRCTGYKRILEAILAASRQPGHAGPGDGR
ncbi:MAG TPA: (2Fe-2S)-binding protein [Methylomirabilota bacterium]|jgi:carbon-monoxide dehydrogenase small subunit|nr:(2Fe-2S)-binding protein [Methylomirabilota bacterium]